MRSDAHLDSDWNMSPGRWPPRHPASGGSSNVSSSRIMSPVLSPYHTLSHLITAAFVFPISNYPLDDEKVTTRWYFSRYLASPIQSHSTKCNALTESSPYPSPHQLMNVVCLWQLHSFTASTDELGWAAPVSSLNSCEWGWGETGEAGATQTGGPQSLSLQCLVMPNAQVVVPSFTESDSLQHDQKILWHFDFIIGIFDNGLSLNSSHLSSEIVWQLRLQSLNHHTLIQWQWHTAALPPLSSSQCTLQTSLVLFQSIGFHFLNQNFKLGTRWLFLKISLPFELFSLAWTEELDIP